VLKLIYQSVTFGLIDLEYTQAMVRVGSSEDNDLVLRHPSIKPYHCQLVFQCESVFCLPPTQGAPSPADFANPMGPKFGAGDRILIGDLQFRFEHSSRTVAVPPMRLAVASGNGPVTQAPEAEKQPGYFCRHCRLFIRDNQVKRLGLIGHAKKDLCPKCSRPLEPGLECEQISPKPSHYSLPGASNLSAG
jgi:hypothetical protein